MIYSLDEIAHHTGLPEEKVSEICNLLVVKGYLNFDNSIGKYRLTTDRDHLERVKKMWSQCSDDYKFEQMSAKIEDIIQFGKPLALSEKNPKSTIDNIGVPGLNFIFGYPDGFVKKKSDNTENMENRVKDEMNVTGLPRGYCLLIKGAPGSGKTTLGMQIALHLKNRRARFLTFEENVSQMLKDFDGYIKHEETSSNDHYGMGWNRENIKAVTRSLIKIHSPKAWANPDLVMQELISIFDHELPHLVVIDSISRFRDLGGDEKARMILRRLIRSLKCRRITAIFLAEDRSNEFPFEDYDVDGVIHLGWAGETLTLSIKKMRGMKAYKGPHSAALMPVEEFDTATKHNNCVIAYERKRNNGLYLTVGFNVFPDIAVFTEKNIYREKKSDTPFSTGTKGLDNLLPLQKGKKGLKEGETVLIVGSAGAGKTLLSINFMLNGFFNKSQTNNKEHVVWINLEGSMETLKFAVQGFEGKYKEEIDRMLGLGKEEKTKPSGDENCKSRFDFIDFPPINLDLNKIVYTLEAIHRKYTIQRLVIDSITELERAKGGGQPDVKVFLAGLIQFLRERKITTFFVCRSDAFFRSIDKIEEQVSSLVDLIICIRNFDIHNQIQKGIYIQKARGRRHISKIMRLSIDSVNGIEVEDSGWDLENLLAGDSSTIEKPKVFFKLFYENPAEEFINRSIIQDFDQRRYPADDPKFTLVKKPSIYTEFWSFKGQYSAGHANTRVLSIADHVIPAFRDSNRLANLEKYVKSEVWQNILNEKHLSTRYLINKMEEKNTDSNFLTLDQESGTVKRIIDAVPCYRDYGVMILREDIKYSPNNDCNDENDVIELEVSEKWEGYFKFLKQFVKNPDEDQLNYIINNYTWKKFIEELIVIKSDQERIKDQEGIKDKCGNEILPFAMPPLEQKSEFVAFFMELLWSHGGDIYIPDILHTMKIRKNEDFQEVIKKSIFIEFIHYCQLDEKNEKIQVSDFIGKTKIIIDNLSKSDKNEIEKYRILNHFEKRCQIYGFDKRDNLDMDEFKRWIIEKGLEPICASNRINWDDELEKSVLFLNGESFKKTIKLLLDLVHTAGVKNPIDGEFRHNSVFSRNWYSRATFLSTDKCKYCFKNKTSLCSNPANKINSDKIREDDKRITAPEFNTKSSLLPLPLVETNKTYINDSKNVTINLFRSATCFTYWSLVMLDNALSPEIGGNFIESMNAPEYYELRLKYRLGIPVMDQEVEKGKYNQFHPESYSILKRAIHSGIEYKEMRTEISKVLKSKEESKESDDYVVENRIKEKIIENPAFLSSKFIDYIDYNSINPGNGKKNEEELNVLFNNHIFHSKVRQSRTAYYQVEQALHYQLKQLFTKNPSDRSRYLYDRKNIYEEICESYNPNPSKEKKEEGYIEYLLQDIQREFRTHVIFELLTYFFHQHQRSTTTSIEEKPES